MYSRCYLILINLNQGHREKDFQIPIGKLRTHKETYDHQGTEEHSRHHSQRSKIFGNHNATTHYLLHFHLDTNQILMNSSLFLVYANFQGQRSGGKDSFLAERRCSKGRC